jgi:cyclase
MGNTKPTMFYGADMIIFENAKRLRNNMTPAEDKLWQRVSKNKLGVRFKAQHPVSNFIVDFYCHKAKLVIEVDGDIHFSEEGAKQDILRTEELEKLELKVIRFTNDQIFHDINGVLEKIKMTLHERSPHSSI